jgi:hypothetical protein
MTALLVLERGRLDEIATVGPGAERETGSRIGLKAGDRMKVRDLLAAAVIQSANDACRALAEHVGGTEARFAAMMNRRARWASHPAVNACGRPAGHLSTARDLARIAEAALAHKFRRPCGNGPDDRSDGHGGARSTREQERIDRPLPRGRRKSGFTRQRKVRSPLPTEDARVMPFSWARPAVVTRSDARPGCRGKESGRAREVGDF